MRDNNYQFQTYKVSVAPSEVNEPKGDNTVTSDTGEIEDRLNEIQIEQLHRATLNFSNNSLETKKLCMTVMSAVFTTFVSIYSSFPSDKRWMLKACIIAIPLFFYVVDVVFYFYQDSLREKMIKEENEIRKRHGLELRTFRKKDLTNSKDLTDSKRLGRSLFNKSQIMYGLLLVLNVCLSLYL